MGTTSRNYYKNPYTLEVDTVTLFGEFSVGAAGAVSGILGGGIANVVKEAAAGKYTISTTDKFAKFLDIKILGIDDAALTFAQAQVFQDPATLQADIKSAKAVTVQLLDFAGAAVNPANGTKIMFELKFRQSSIGRYDA